MIILEERFNADNEWQQGYFLSMEQLISLSKDFLAKSLDSSFVRDDESYIEEWLKKQGEEDER